ncbi:hypothetical protein BMJ34_02540 [Sinorhizobium medicae]|uniref:hypothetical protein n=1 Tax=Sinorhizobium medicae TaxID=110321 RepID=UPI000C7C3066|nr:hypothetical protein [Sinorhizobium medicae]PLU08427.1 hypothetical protein BMJ34_02540 [Sinorhizobium medicae]PLU16203.1 hypothetical protein BMJ30_18240 [Sinorhizobium medicae]PLU30895.1 hypothetical protein BMJ27_22720 [Sinorhizobium medicae]
MILEDFIMLGKTIPETQKKSGRVFVCSAGYSAEMGRLVRIYPLARFKSPPRWSISRVALERNPDDSREESWKLRGDRSAANHNKINKCFEHVGDIHPTERVKIVERLSERMKSIKEANEQRRSLCIIRPRSVPLLSFEENPESPDHPQLALFDELFTDEVPAGSKRFSFQPYLEFKDSCGWHHLQVRDWGGYEFMRKHGDDRRHELAAIWQLDRRPCFLVGNMSHQRNVWLVISVLMPASQIGLELEAA